MDGSSQPTFTLTDERNNNETTMVTTDHKRLYGRMALAKTITIVGTADLQGVMEPSLQKFDLNGDGKKEKLKMGGIANLATL